MARKMMTKEVTSTIVKASKMVVVEGVPTAQPLEDITLLGNVSMENAQRVVEKEHGKGVLVFEVIPDTKKYEMSVEEFIKVATLVTEEKEEVLV